MKYFLTCLALGIAFAAGAQTGLVEFPYNPDADSDDVIGTVDLLALLSLYGSEFSEENLYLDNDTTHALMHVGVLNYPSCMNECRNLPGSWRIANQADLMLHYDELAPSGNTITTTWIYKDFKNMTTMGASRLVLFGSSFYQYDRIQIDNDFSGNTSSGRLANTHNCYCATHERPKVEYSYCRTSDGSEFTTCCNEKVADGWYPLAATTGVSGNAYAGGEEFGQAFWRWAE